MPGIFESNLLRDDFRVILSQKFFGPWSGVILRSVSPRYAPIARVVAGMRRASTGEEIVSEEYGRQIRPCWLVVQPQGHQRHGLDDSKAILEAPTKKV